MFKAALLQVGVKAILIVQDLTHHGFELCDLQVLLGQSAFELGNTCGVHAGSATIKFLHCVNQHIIQSTRVEGEVWSARIDDRLGSVLMLLYALSERKFLHHIGSHLLHLLCKHTYKSPFVCKAGPHLVVTVPDRPHLLQLFKTIGVVLNIGLQALV